MPAIFTAQLAERGETYQVVSVYFNEIQYIIPNAKYVDLPNRVALQLKGDLNSGKFITIKKSDVDDRKSPDINIDKFTIIKPRSLDKLKALERSKVSQRLGVYASLLKALDIFDFFVITGKLQSMGFNILNEANKEEVFLDIINTGNEDLISDLERFLETKDIFDNVSKKYRCVKNYFREINECDTKEELQEVIDSNNGWLIS